jgi:hypothetical protein
MAKDDSFQTLYQVSGSFRQELTKTFASSLQTHVNTNGSELSILAENYPYSG